MEVFKVKIGMFTSGYQRNPIEHIFMDAKRFGYDYIELWGGRPHAYPFDLKKGVELVTAYIYESRSYAKRAIKNLREIICE